MTTNNVILGAAVALTALAGLTLDFIGPAPSGPRANAAGKAFAARLQPDPAVLAGIGSTRTLKPVDLRAATPSAQAPSQTRAPADSNHQGGRHAVACIASADHR